MERFSEKVIVFFSFVIFTISCSAPEYKYATKSNYKELSDRMEDIDDEHERRASKVKYDYKKIRNYTGYYKVGTPYKISGKTYYPKEDKNYKEVGIASWYGDDFHNKKTANSETYDMHDFTCAHRTLPLPSLVKITNLQNGKSMIVRVNDRGPFAKDRIVDVSKNVAKKLGFYSQGTTKVKIEFLEKETNEMLKYLKLK